MTLEEIRLSESGTRKKHWKRWGPYLSERAWATGRGRARQRSDSRQISGRLIAATLGIWNAIVT